VKSHTMTNTESAIWNRMLEPAGRTLSVAAARSLLKLDFPTADKDRMRTLAARARDGTLTAAERGEIREYERVGNLLALLKSKARQRLKRAGQANGTAHGRA
jgi:hypothetical protein